MHVTVTNRRVVLALAAIAALLTIANTAVLWIKFRWHHDSVFGLAPLFDFNREGNLPAFYSACALLLAALLFLVVGGDAWKRGEPWRRYWVGLGVIFLFLAVDEAAELHGLLSLPIRRFANASGPLLFAWVIPYLVLTLSFAAAYLRFFWGLPTRLRTLLGAAAVIYLAGAVGLEVVGGTIVSANGGLEAGGLDHWLHAVSYTVEEVLEMAGVLIVIDALLEYIAEKGITVTFRASAG
jgi:hypothetical protein